MRDFCIHTNMLTTYLLAGCTSVGKNRSLQPNANTNEVAKDNLNLSIEYMWTGKL